MPVRIDTNPPAQQTTDRNVDTGVQRDLGAMIGPRVATFTSASRTTESTTAVEGRPTTLTGFVSAIRENPAGFVHIADSLGPQARSQVFTAVAGIHTNPDGTLGGGNPTGFHAALATLPEPSRTENFMVNSVAVGDMIGRLATSYYARAGASSRPGGPGTADRGYTLAAVGTPLAA